MSSVIDRMSQCSQSDFLKAHLINYSSLSNEIFSELNFFIKRFQENHFLFDLDYIESTIDEFDDHISERFTDLALCANKISFILKSEFDRKKQYKDSFELITRRIISNFIKYDEQCNEIDLICIPSILKHKIFINQQIESLLPSINNQDNTSIKESESNFQLYDNNSYESGSMLKTDDFKEIKHTKENKQSPNQGESNDDNENKQSSKSDVSSDDEETSQAEKSNKISLKSNKSKDVETVNNESKQSLMLETNDKEPTKSDESTKNIDMNQSEKSKDKIPKPKSSKSIKDEIYGSPKFISVIFSFIVSFNTILLPKFISHFISIGNKDPYYTATFFVGSIAGEIINIIAVRFSINSKLLSVLSNICLYIASKPLVDNETFDDKNRLYIIMIVIGLSYSIMNFQNHAILSSCFKENHIIIYSIALILGLFVCIGYDNSFPINLYFTLLVSNFLVIFIATDSIKKNEINFSSIVATNMRVILELMLILPFTSYDLFYISTFNCILFYVIPVNYQFLAIIFVIVDIAVYIYLEFPSLLDGFKSFFEQLSQLLLSELILIALKILLSFVAYISIRHNFKRTWSLFRTYNCKIYLLAFVTTICPLILVFILIIILQYI